MTIEKKTLPEQHYVYVEREAEMTPEGMGKAIESGFGEVFGFVGSTGAVPLSMPMTLYVDMPEGNTIKFRAGVMVSAEDAGKAGGNVKAGTIPAGDAVTMLHRGSYANLNQSHKAVWDYCDAQGLTKGMPVWEIYVDDPMSTPEAEVRTEIYRKVG